MAQPGRAGLGPAVVGPRARNIESTTVASGIFSLMTECVHAPPQVPGATGRAVDREAPRVAADVVVVPADPSRGPGGRRGAGPSPAGPRRVRAPGRARDLLLAADRVPHLPEGRER